MDTQRWQWAKQEVVKRSANYEDVIKDALKRDPKTVTRKRDLTDQGVITTVELGKVAGYNLDMSVKDHDKKGIIEANYYLWDMKNSKVFIRELLNPPELRQLPA